MNSNSIERSIKDRVKQIAKAQNRSFAEVWQSVILERWLIRMAHSPYQKYFIFKGGMCLNHYLKLGRATKDLDFLIKGISAQRDELQTIFSEISSKEMNDGIVFNSLNVGLLNHPHMNYPGYEVTMRADLGQSRTPIRIDIGIGDIVKPENITIHLAASNEVPLFEKEIQLWAYDPETIFAEKYETAVKRDALNSRMKDYHDLFILIGAKILDKEKCIKAIQSTFKIRKTKFSLIPNFTGTDLERLENLWRNHKTKLNRSESKASLPEKFKQLVNEVNLWVESLLLL